MPESLMMNPAFSAARCSRGMCRCSLTGGLSKATLEMPLSGATGDNNFHAPASNDGERKGLPPHGSILESMMPSGQTPMRAKPLANCNVVIGFSSLVRAARIILGLWHRLKLAPGVGRGQRH